MTNTETSNVVEYASVSTAIRGVKRRATGMIDHLSNEQIAARYVKEEDNKFIVDLDKAGVQTKPLKGVSLKRSSDEPEGATGAVRAFFDDYAADVGEELTRKGAIAAAVEAGFAYYTARTQYQKWFAAQ